MKKLFILLIIILSFSIQNYTYAIKINVVSQEQKEELNREITRKEAFLFFWDFFKDKMPESYKYIEVKYIDVEDKELYEALQKLIYLDLIKNIDRKIYPNRKINLYNFLKLSENILWWDFVKWWKKSELSKKYTKVSDFKKINSILNIEENNFEFWLEDDDVDLKKAIFSNVYDTIINYHYNKETLDKWEMIDLAIEGLVNWVWDKFTTYFPPTESKNFYDSLNWEYEWIGAYVDMEEAWKMKIVSPVPDSPSEKAWLKWWDLVLKVDGKEITKNNSLQEVVSWIKWPAWTVVTLTIQRWKEIFDINITRWKIVIEDVEYKMLNKKIFYIKIKSFWENVVWDFKKALTELENHKRVKKIILDLRNNGWWYLWKVVNMLWYFVPKSQVVAVVKYPEDSKEYYSAGFDFIDFSKYELVILQNSWTASASEILIWTIKDYYPEATIIWEQSYWKGSVQSVKSYRDGSSLKFTVAKWFTWKTETWIDWIWITPDIMVEYDIEKYKKYGIDNQLEKAKYK